MRAVRCTIPTMSGPEHAQRRCVYTRPVVVRLAGLANKRERERARLDLMYRLAGCGKSCCGKILRTLLCGTSEHRGQSGHERYCQSEVRLCRDAHRMAHRTPRPQALSSPTGLFAGAPAGRSADGVRTTQLLGTRAGWLRCDAAHAGPCKACTRSSSCALAAGMLVVFRAGVPASLQAVGEGGERAARE